MGLDIKSFAVGVATGGGVTPTGNINITDTNSTDVTNYATAQVVDADLVAGNIKKDVDILGVTGTYEGEEPELEDLTATANGTYTHSGKDGYDTVVVNVPSQEPDIDAITITANGTYTASECDGYSPVTVNVPVPTVPVDYIECVYDNNNNLKEVIGHGYSNKVVPIYKLRDGLGNAVPIWFGETAVEKIIFPTNSSLGYVDSIRMNNLTNLVEVQLPDGANFNSFEIIQNFFTYSTSLATVRLPNGITVLPTATFRGCSSLTSFAIPNTVTTINQNCFSESGLTSITIPVTVTTLHSNGYQFSTCTSLTTVNCLGTFTVLPANCFISCSNLSSVNAPNITNIQEACFQNCASLASFDFSNITNIASYAFKNSGLTEIELGSNLTSLNYTQSFGYCSRLTKVTFNSTISQYDLSTTTFAGCTNLRDIYVPWANGAVANAPWGATNATIHYNS